MRQENGSWVEDDWIGRWAHDLGRSAGSQTKVTLAVRVVGVLVSVAVMLAGGVFALWAGSYWLYDHSLEGAPVGYPPGWVCFLLFWLGAGVASAGWAGAGWFVWRFRKAS